MLACGEEFNYEGEPEGFKVDPLHSLLLAAKAALNKDDYPSWWNAMKIFQSDDW